MEQLKQILLFGDSILKGIQINPLNKKYYTKNDMDITSLSQMFSLNITNESRFGCTVTKAKGIIAKNLQRGKTCDAIIMDFGGNDCDYKWSEISENPEGVYQPNTPLHIFKKEYTDLIKALKSNGILPILTTLPPLEPQRFFNWWCANLNKENIMKWLGSIDTIYKHQENYSKCIEEIAKEEHIPLVDLRAAFLAHGDVPSLMCEDGTHPNSKGQEVMTKAFKDFVKTYTPSLS